MTFSAFSVLYVGSLIHVTYLQNPQLLWVLLASILVGIGLGWALTYVWYRSHRLIALREANTQLAASQIQIRELRNQITSLQQVQDHLRQEVRLMEVAKVAAETKLEDRQHSLAHQKASLEETKVTLTDTFRSLASQALAGNNKEFLTLAEEKFRALKEETAMELDQRHSSIASILQPLTESLGVYQKESQALEDKRLREMSAVGEQLRQLASAQSSLQTETAKLVNALRSPQVRGRWGEIALRKTAELAGMSANCDFYEQESVSTEAGQLRPDMIVKLPAGRDVVVDSKVPFNAFLESLEAETEEAREAALTRHARQVKRHVSQLASKEYWDQFPSSPEFVVLFIPNDSFLAAAAEQDPDLVETALTRNVVIATPTTFIALLRAIAYGWRQEQMAENAQRISFLGQELADRMGTLAEHFSKMGHVLGRTVELYNTTVASLENRIMPTARKFKHLGINAKKEVIPLHQMEQNPKPPSETLPSNIPPIPTD